MKSSEPKILLFATRVLSKIVGKTRAHYIGLVALFVRRELKIKYRGTFLGYLWSMVNPLLFMLIISFVFRSIIHTTQEYNYKLYILSGILFWNISLHTLTSGAHSIVQNANLLRKVKMPIWVFPMIPLGSSFTNFILALVPYSCVSIFLGVYPTHAVFLLPFVLFLYAIFLYGLALILASANVFFRDVAHILEPALQLVFYATPIIYDRFSINFPTKGAALLALNPFVYFVEGLRGTILPKGGIINFDRITLLAAFALTSILIGALVYKKTKRKMIFNL